MTKIIVLDAGHSLVTPGKQTLNGSKGIIKEWSLNNKVAIAIEDHLLNNYEDIKVYRSDDMTGKTDKSLAARAQNADNKGADLFISLHHNAGGGTGTEVYYHTYGTAADKKIAQLIAPKLANALACRNRGVKHAKFSVLNCRSTAVLVEGLFMDTESDYNKMIQEHYQFGYAKAVSESIAEFLSLKKKPQTSKELYRVRKSWNDVASQKGAYSSLENAKKECNKYKGYSVYSNNGKIIFTNKSKVVKVGAKVKVIGSHYATGEKVPEWVKKELQVVNKINGEKAYLGRINSWVYLSDLKLWSIKKIFNCN